MWMRACALCPVFFERLPYSNSGSSASPRPATRFIGLGPVGNKAKQRVSSCKQTTRKAGRQAGRHAHTRAHTRTHAHTRAHKLIHASWSDLPCFACAFLLLCSGFMRSRLYRQRRSSAAKSWRHPTKSRAPHMVCSLGPCACIAWEVV